MENEAGIDSEQKKRERSSATQRKARVELKEKGTGGRNRQFNEKRGDRESGGQSQQKGGTFPSFAWPASVIHCSSIRALFVCASRE